MWHKLLGRAVETWRELRKPPGNAPEGLRGTNAPSTYRRWKQNLDQEMDDDLK